MKSKIICGQMEVIPGRPDLNYQKISQLIATAKEKSADILVLPEMCLSGYLLGDIWEQQSFLDDCGYYAQQIIDASDGICIIFGSIATEENAASDDGRIRKYEAAFVAQDRVLHGGSHNRPYIIKSLLADERAFDDSRHFCSLQKLSFEENFNMAAALQPVEISIRGTKLCLGIMTGADGHTKAGSCFDIPKLLAANGAQLLFHLDCVPYQLDKDSVRPMETELPLLRCGNVGIQNSGKNIFTYAGGTAAYDGAGRTIASAEMYAETLLETIYDTEAGTLSALTKPMPLPSDTEAIYKALRYGTEKFLQQCGISKMTIGLSGGIDSAVTAAMYVDILGPENVLLLNLPSIYNSQQTQDLARAMARNLKTNYTIIPIRQSFEHTVAQLESTSYINFATGESSHLHLSGLIKENIQARDRGARIIAAASAAFGGAFSCNANKTEISIGYATFYGDICGALTIIGDLWKHQVYALGRYLNEKVYGRAVIPEEIFTIRPSAELSASQTVGTGGDPLIYEYHDYLLRAFIERKSKATPADILRWYKEGVLATELGCTQEAIGNAFATTADFIADLERWWNLFAGFAVAKRIQSPPILSVSKRAFGSDHREAQLSPYFSREYYALKEELLGK